MDQDELLEIIDEAKSGTIKLSLRGRGITELPPEIGNLTTALTWLDLSNNQLRELPPEIGQLTKLTDLFLFSNLLGELPPEFGQLTALCWLDLSDNKLSVLPPEFGQLTDLISLNLSSNQLKELPPEIRQLTNLTGLYLYDNLLRELPPEIGQLSTLTRLNLKNNQLSELPPEIIELTRLERLDLHDNSLPIPPEILRGKPAEILAYYFENVATEAATRPLNEVKMLVVGQGAVGKTSLVRRLMTGTFDPDEDTTHGIYVEPWSITVNEEQVQVNIWDFGGQVIMHATHQFFLTERSLYLLVLTAREDEAANRLDYWLKIIDSFGKGSPVIVVVNKIDQWQLGLNYRTLQETYPQIKAFVNTSCLNGEGIGELKEAIVTEIGQLEHLHNRLAVSWFTVKQQLEEMEKDKIDYITYDQYREICQSQGITEVTSEKTLLRFLHELGVVLSFIDDRRLEDTHVLNPDWVTTGVYAIITDNGLQEAGGILHAGDLNRMLDPGRYPSFRHGFILDMMEKFELCFVYPDGEHYLIPDLLPKNEPDLPDFSESLQFAYHYNVLPTNVMSRFIVRVNRYFKFAHACWRNGVMFGDEHNQALVIANRDRGTIHISVMGDSVLRKEFLLRIRTYLDDIHVTIPGIKATEFVPVPGHPGVEVPYQNLLTHERLEQTHIIPPGMEELVEVKWLLDGVSWDAEREKGTVIKVGGDLVLRDKVGRDKISLRDIIDSADFDIGG